jgi:hypothetical protein
VLGLNGFVCVICRLIVLVLILLRLSCLKGKRFLFKVEKPTMATGFFNGSYRVKRVCGDHTIIAKFALDGFDYTPTKVTVFLCC